MHHYALYRRTLSPPIIILSLYVFQTVSLQGQDRDLTRVDSFEVETVEFEGNETFNDDLLASLLQTKESIF